MAFFYQLSVLIGLVSEFNSTSETFTFITPRPNMPRLSAVHLDKSKSRPSMNGPLSFILTITDLPFFRFVT